MVNEDTVGSVDGCEKSIEILHQLVDGLSMFIPVFIGFQMVSTIHPFGGAGVRNHPQ